MDTNHDGVLTIQDDPYSPFYPGTAFAACSTYQCAYMPEPSQQLHVVHQGRLSTWAVWRLNHGQPLGLRLKRPAGPPATVQGASILCLAHVVAVQWSALAELVPAFRQQARWCCMTVLGFTEVTAAGATRTAAQATSMWPGWGCPPTAGEALAAPPT